MKEMELRNAGNTGNTGNSQTTTRSQEEEGDRWEGRRPQVTHPNLRIERRQDDDDEGRMVLQDVNESNWALNSVSAEASCRLIERATDKRNDPLSSVPFSR